jgi:multiple sugar transport system ATP-binding protein
VAEIRLDNIHKLFGDFVAVEDVSLTIDDGQFFVLLGSSGCGKTTTLRMIAGLEVPSSGQVLLGGEDVTFRKAAERNIAFVFQMFALYPHMRVRENLGFPLKTQHKPRAEIKKRVQEVAELLRIEHLLNSPVGGLAGGDRQRVALGRAIIRRPKAFLMDEPMGTLDAEFREIMRKDLRSLHDRIEATTIYVTHDQIEAMAMGDMIAVMSHGKVLQAAPPMEIYTKPSSMFVAGFVGSPAINFLPFDGAAPAGSTQVKVNGTMVDIPTLHEGLNGNGGVLGARPENIWLAGHDGLPGKVYGVEYMGARKLVTVDTNAGRIRVMAPDNIPAAVDDNVKLKFRTDSLVVFDRKSERALASDLIKDVHHV